MSNVTQVVANDTYTKLLVNSDRFLRLYSIQYPGIDSSSGSAAASISQDARFELLDTFQDVINQHKWLHCQFLRLNDQTKIINQVPTSESLMGQPSLLTPA